MDDKTIRVFGQSAVLRVKALEISGLAELEEFEPGVGSRRRFLVPEDLERLHEQIEAAMCQLQMKVVRTAAVEWQPGEDAMFVISAERGKLCAMCLQPLPLERSPRGQLTPVPDGQ